MTTPRMRAGTTDRQDAVDRLSRHFAEGRLDTDEFDTRVTKAYAATYLDELPELLEDLPEGRPQPGRQLSRQPEPRRVAAAGHFYDDRPEPWRGQLQRPPRWLGVAVLIGLVFAIGALTHGIFLFPLIWLAFAFSATGGRRHRWEGQNSDWRCRR